MLAEIAIILPAAATLRGDTDILAHLGAVPPTEIAARRALLRDLAFSLQYSITDTSPEMLQQWGPDAVEVMLAGMMRHAAGQGDTDLAAFSAALKTPL